MWNGSTRFFATDDAAGTAGAVGTETTAATQTTETAAAAAATDGALEAGEADGWEVESKSVGTLPGDDKRESRAAAGTTTEETDAERQARERDDRGRFKAGEKTAEAAGAAKTEAERKTTTRKGKESQDEAIRRKDAETHRYRREAEGRAEENRQLQTRIADLERRLSGSATTEIARPAVDGKTAPATDEPKKFAFPKWEDFQAVDANKDKTYEDFLDERLEAKQTFERTQKAETEHVARLRDEQDAVDRSYASRLLTYREQRPEFDELIRTRGKSVPSSEPVEYITKRSERCGQILEMLVTHPTEALVIAALNMPRLLADNIAASPVADAILLHFGQKPEAYRALMSNPPPVALRALVSLEQDLVAARSPQGPARETTTVTRASRPIRPVGGGPGVGDTSPDLDDMDFSPEWIRAENQRIAARESARR